MSSAIEVLHQEIRASRLILDAMMCERPMSSVCILIAAREAAFAFSCAMAIEILEAWQ